MSVSSDPRLRTAWPPLPTPPDPGPARLPWRAGRAWPVTPPADQGELGRRLRDAGVLDLNTLELPGAAVLLPYGVALVRRFRDTVDRRLGDAGFAEYELPHLLPASTIDPSRRVLGMEGRVLWAVTDADVEEGRRRAFLCRTGEPAVHTHWRRVVRTLDDLPIHMYRRCRYFGPAPRGRRAGRGVMMGIEAADVFEAHSCLATAQDADATFDRLLGALRSISLDLHVPTLWTTRPRSTNIAVVAGERVGGDVPLTTGVTVQTSAVYAQGTVFSEPYGVRVRGEDGSAWAPHTVAGYLTRRVLYAHLAYAAAAYGRPLPHPDLAPVQVTVSAPVAGEPERGVAAALVAALEPLNVGAEQLHGDRDEVARARRALRGRGVAVEVLVLPERTVLVAGDTGEEVELPPGAGTGAARAVADAVADVGERHARRIAKIAADRIVEAATVAEAREALRRRVVVALPLAFDDALAEQVGTWRSGEVLGWLTAPDAAACALTGEAVATRALISGRL